MCVSRLLLLVLALYSRDGVPNYGEAATTKDDPVLNKLRSQLVANNYDYEQSESIEKALRAGGSQDATPRTEDHAEDVPQVNGISDESELSDFGLDRNVLNGYITDMSDINAKPIPRANDDTFMANGREPDTAQNLDELSDAEVKDLSESAPEETPDVLSDELSAEQATIGQQRKPVQQPSSPSKPAKAVQQLQPKQIPMVKQPQPKQSPVKQPKRKQPALKQPELDQAGPVLRSRLDTEPEDEMEQPEQVLPEEGQEQQPQQEMPVQWSLQQGLQAAAAQQPQRKWHVVSPYLAGDQTTEGIPYKVLTGHGQRHGRRSGASMVQYLQTQLNNTVVVAPLGPGPMPDFQLPRGRRQYREISDDEELEDAITSSKEKIDRRRAY